ncbi:putative cysteine ligase BshC [Filimonas sp.]|nr:putative cysteine ligase BshC [Filimonas sp.]
MKAQATYLTYSDTHSFSKLVIDYLNEEPALKEFISEFPSKESIKRQIARKKLQTNDRTVLVDALQSQYENITLSSEVQENLTSLKEEHTFTICTAHQPNIFTGYLYFIYKIIHAIKLAQECNAAFPDARFVPVYYMGSEDNDIEEIGTFHYNEKTFTWNTRQTGACGRMNILELLEMVQEINRTLNDQIADEAFLMALLKQAYDGKNTLAEATRILVNTLFGKYGLLVIDGDDVLLKTLFKPLIRHELLHQDSQPIVLETVSKLSTHYKVQANPRDINLFYLKDNLRERIEYAEGSYQVVNTSIIFNEAELLAELDLYPDRFSPNVILRPLYQETILPNVAFIGGGGELAYWLELKALFEKHQLVYPIIFLRNSVLWIHEKTQEGMNKLPLPMSSFFQPEETIFKQLFHERDTIRSLENLLETLNLNYESVITLGASVSPDLSHSMQAHQAKAKRIADRIVQKFYAQLKKKEELTFDRIIKIRDQIAPDGHLQERYDNFLSVYKEAGLSMFDLLLTYQQAFGKDFLVLAMKKE